MQLAVGTILGNGRYEIKSCIGDGGFGITYLANDNRLDREIVLKEYFPDFMAKRDITVSNEVHTIDSNHSEDLHTGIAKFMKEAKTLAHLNDIQAIATVHDFFEENNTAYIVMEYIKGKSLRQCIHERTQAYTFDEAMKILEPCMMALQRVHEAGIIHRDFAPDNILINHKGQVKIIDFGASRDYVSNNATMTIMVKHGYAPVEQYSSGVKQGPYTDVYSIAAILYEMLTLKKPLPSIDRMISDSLTVPCEINKTVNAAQSAVVMKGLAVVAESRYQSVSEFLSALKNPEGETLNIIGTPTPVTPVQTSAPVNTYQMPNSQTTELINSSSYGDSMHTEIVSQTQTSQQMTSQPQMNQGQFSQPMMNQSQTGGFAPNYQGGYAQNPNGMAAVQNNNAQSGKSKKGLIATIAAAVVAIAIVIGIVVAGSGSSSSDKASSDSNKTKEKQVIKEEKVETPAPAKEEKADVPEPAKEEKAEEAPAVAKPNNDLINIGIVFMDPQIGTYYEMMYKDLQETFTEANGYKASYECQLDSDEQKKAARNMIAKGVDYLAICSNGPTGWDDVLKEAKNAGTEVIFFVNEVDASPSLYSAVIESDMEEEGKTAVNWLLSQTNNPRVLHIQGYMGSQAQKGRTKALEDAAKAGKCTIVTQIQAEWSFDTAYDAVWNAIISNEEFNAIYAENDSMALGALKALQEAGISSEDVYVIGFNWEKAALEQVLAGNMSLDVECTAFYGDAIDKVIKNGAPADKKVIIEDRAFDHWRIKKEDVEKYGL